MGTVDLFDQREVWIDRYGCEHRLRDMSPEYLMNVRNFLERNWPRFRWQYAMRRLALAQAADASLYDVYTGDHCDFFYDHELEVTEEVLEMEVHDTALFRAIERELRRRPHRPWLLRLKNRSFPARRAVGLAR